MAKDKKKNNAFDFSSVDFLIYLWEKRKPLAMITLAGAVLSTIISFTITPKFKSIVIMFPTSGSSVSKSLLSDTYTGRSSIYEIGEEEQAEQLLQVLQSDQLRDMIVNRFDLMKHYEIEPDSKFPKTQLNAEFRSSIKSRLTQYLSVEVEVMDKDPQMAADIANAMAEYTDTIINNMMRERSMQALLLVEKEYKEAEAVMEMINDSLNKIRNMDVNHYETQAERYYEGYAKAVVEGDYRAASTLENKIKELSVHGGLYVHLRDRLSIETGRYSRFKQRYLEAKIEAESNLPQKFMVDYAYPAEKKAYPKKSFIVMASTFSAFLMGIIALIFFENIRKKIRS